MKPHSKISPRRTRTSAFATDFAEAAKDAMLKALILLGIAGAVFFALSGAILASMG